jgi:NADPH:quinone reductase-like Zn-dependent oxidoreductase
MDSIGKPKPALLKRRSVQLVLFAFVALGAVVWFTQPEPPPPPRSSGERMKAIMYHDYGTADVLRLEDTDKLLPNDNQVLIKVHAAAANPLDWHYMRGTPYILRLVDSGLGKPKSPRLGTDVAGVVEAVGRNVTQFKPGDEVFGAARGAFAEYVLASEKNIVRKPTDLTFEQAASVPIAALSALQGLRDKGRIQPGQKVLINGASGGVGTFAVQIAKSFGAEVTGVSSMRNVDLVKSLGADHVIDYTKENFTLSAQRYDVILDNVGNHALSDLRRVMTTTGIYVLVGGGGPDEGNWIAPLVGLIEPLIYSAFVSQEFATLLASINTSDLKVLSEMMETKKVTPVIDRTFGLSDVPAAIRYLETGRARGKVIVSVAPDRLGSE